MTRDAAICAIIDERLRQEALKASGKFAHTCADEVPGMFKLAILTEELGEVARDICEGRNPRSELVQVAAVALAWLESIG